MVRAQPQPSRKMASMVVIEPRIAAAREEGAQAAREWRERKHDYIDDALSAAWEAGYDEVASTWSLLQRRIAERWRAVGFASMRQIASTMGRNDAVVKQIMDGTVQNPRMDTLRELAEALECTLDYLSGAADHNTFVKNLGPTTQGALVISADESEAPAGCTIVDEVNVIAGAGGGAAVELERVKARWAFPTDWLIREFRVDPSQVRLITVGGDSMVPTIMPGDKVLIHLGSRSPSPPGIFACWDGMGLVIKRLEYIEGSNPPRVRLGSDNNRYSTYELTLEEINIVGRVIARWEKLFHPG